MAVTPQAAEAAFSPSTTTFQAPEPAPAAGLADQPLMKKGKSPTKKRKLGKVLGNIATGGVSGVIGKIRKKRKAKKAAKAKKATAMAESPAKKGKAGKVIGNILTGGVSGVVGKLRAKRKAKKAAKKAGAPAKMHTPDHHNIAMPGKELKRKTYKGGNPKSMMI